MRLFLPAALIAVSLGFSGLVSAQLNFPEIPFDSVEPLGEMVAGRDLFSALRFCRTAV